MSYQGKGGRANNYDPNSFEGPRHSERPHNNGLATAGVSGATAGQRHAEGDDFVQAGALYRTMSADEQQRLVDNLAGSLAAVSRDDIIARSIEHFRAADPSYGARVEAAVKALRG
jgi:catalase